MNFRSFSNFDQQGTNDRFKGARNENQKRVIIEDANEDQGDGEYTDYEEVK
jgi:hypothetical protein